MPIKNNNQKQNIYAPFIHITQMMFGKQCVKSCEIYRWICESFTQAGKVTMEVMKRKVMQQT